MEDAVICVSIDQRAAMFVPVRLLYRQGIAILVNNINFFIVFHEVVPCYFHHGNMHYYFFWNFKIVVIDEEPNTFKFLFSIIDSLLQVVSLLDHYYPFVHF